VGHIVTREIALNRFFNPLEIPDFAPASDRIYNKVITSVIRGIEEHTVRREISIAFLFYFRLLHYLDFVDPDRAGIEELRESMLVFSLLNSEFSVLSEFLERELPASFKDLPDGASEIPLEDMRSSVDSLAYQLQMEMKKIYQIELASAAHIKDVNKLRTAVIRSRGVLYDILRQSIVQLASMFRPNIKGVEVFPAFKSKLELSLKLRKDAWVFHKVTAHFEKILQVANEVVEYETVQPGFNQLTNYIFYFQNISFQTVRYADREHFEKFFDTISGVDEEDFSNPDYVRELELTVHSFRMFLGATLGNIEQRAELYQRPMGIKEGQEILAQFLR